MAKKIKMPSQRALYLAIILIIAACIFGLNFYVSSKLKDIQNSSQTVIYINDPAISDEIEYIIPDTYKMLELYDDNFGLLYRSRANDGNPVEALNISAYRSQLISYKKTNDWQNLSHIDENCKHDIYFRWVKSETGRSTIIIAYGMGDVQFSVWIVSFICYFILMLLFAVITLINSKTYGDSIEKYQNKVDQYRKSKL